MNKGPSLENKLRSQVQVLFTESQISDRIEAMAREIEAAYAGQELTVVCTLKGSVVFFSDLIRRLNLPICCEFLSVSSYAGKQSTGDVKLNLDLSCPIEGKHLLLVEDIVDSGLTLEYLKKLLSTRKLASLKVATLLDKPEARKAPVFADFVGFSIANEFVVGFGLDYDQKLRELPFIGRLPHGFVG